ncbi:ribbon-helix-helix domain-containing protein [uncultured Clostridium sp.]|jgi:hypothetical protein|uniref:ribbon-helix-helix domain-containing protein n=1 Tax=uncultured Clostridium sp. TaxID=59620 RepID=UPI00260FC5AD|nr:ribbon-helix-helix domain-containing protein [uncultured Clostridium sp.]
MAEIKKTYLKNRTPIGSAMDNKIYYEMKGYSEKTGIPISKMLDRAMSMYLNTVK